MENRESTIAIQRKELASLRTRKLLRYRDKALACGGIGYDPTCNHGDIIPIELIYEELNKREHVPNKKEAKIIRQNKAKSNK